MIKLLSGIVDFIAWICDFIASLFDFLILLVELIPQLISEVFAVLALLPTPIIVVITFLVISWFVYLIIGNFI